MPTDNTILVRLPIGEVCDRVTINNLKISHGTKNKKIISDAGQWLVEIQLLVARKFADGSEGKSEFDSLFAELEGINKQIWDIEDSIRVLLKKSKEQSLDESDQRYLELLMRRVPQNNDARSEVKRKINSLFGNDGGEEKIYVRDRA